MLSVREIRALVKVCLSRMADSLFSGTVRSIRSFDGRRANHRCLPNVMGVSFLSQVSRSELAAIACNRHARVAVSPQPAETTVERLAKPFSTVLLRIHRGWVQQPVREVHARCTLGEGKISEV